MGSVRSFAARRSIINQDQIEIRGEGHLPAAEPAHSDHCERPSGHSPVAPRKIRFDCREQCGERCLGDVGEDYAGLDAVEGAAQ